MDYKFPTEIEELILLFKELPGVGRKGAERMVFSIIKWDLEKSKWLGEKISSLHSLIKKCSICSNISTGTLCDICSDNTRKHSTICVVEEFSQIQSLEEAGYRGLYHILNGKISPLGKRGAEDINLLSLLERISANNSEIKELIIALSQDVEGRATAFYIAEELKHTGIKITALARGVPAGADITYANSATIAAAISGRISVI